MTLDKASIEAAIAELEHFANVEIEERCAKLREMIGQRIRWSAEHGFSTALVSDIVKGPDDQVNDVTVSMTHDDKLTVVFAQGSKALFIEFGAGVYYNEPAGESPHPWGVEMGYIIGGYGQGKGVHHQWTFGHGANFHLTRGTPAAMPMYRGYQEAYAAIDEMAKEVFG